MFGKIEILRQLIDVNEILEERIGDIPELELNTSQQKLILYLVSKIKDDSWYEYEPVDYDDFCRLFNIPENDERYEKVNEELTEMLRKIFLMPTMYVKPRRMCMWLAGANIDYSKNCIYFKLSDTFKPYYRYLKKKIDLEIVNPPAV